jgi:carboxymethylenebutenolidase
VEKTTMCFDHHARPPISPIAGGATDAHDLTLTATDGTEFLAYAARAVQPSAAGMIVLPDVRGLHQYYKELTLRFAEHGIDAIAIDYFGRTAPSNDRGESFEWMPHVQQTRAIQVQADVAEAAKYLRSTEGGEVRALFCVGFCFGGSLSFRQAASNLDFAGVIGFYGWPLGLPLEVDSPKPIDPVDRFHSAVLAIYGGGDPGIPPEAIQQFDAALGQHGIPRETYVYDGAPHSFFDRTQAEHAAASADAWERVRDFVARHTPDVPAP